MGLARQEHPFSQQAEKAAGHTGSRRIYVAASSADDIRLSGPSARHVLARRVQGSDYPHYYPYYHLQVMGLTYSNTHQSLPYRAQFLFIYLFFISVCWCFSTYICYIHIHCLLQLYTIQETLIEQTEYINNYGKGEYE